MEADNSWTPSFTTYQLYDNGTNLHLFIKWELKCLPHHSLVCCED